MKILNPQIDLDAFFKKVGEGDSLLILDYDGTLAPFVAERMQAFVYPGMGKCLECLADLKTTKVVIMSGRQLSDFDVLLPHLPFEIWGSHGRERRHANGEKVVIPIDPTAQDGLARGLKVLQRYAENNFYEIKPYSIALHWREMDPEERNDIVSLVEGAWNLLIANFPLEIRQFDGGIELKVEGVDKGTAVKTLLSEVPYQAAIAYLGDDMTDEDAFRALGDRGLKVLVREELRPTLADIQLIPPDEVFIFLNRWRSMYG